MAENAKTYRLESHRAATGTSDPGDWIAQEPGERYQCFVCGGATKGVSPGEYVEVDLLYSDPTYVLSVGAHTECLRQVAAEGSEVAHPNEDWRERNQRRPGRPATPPTVSFPVYGVTESSWTGPRWFDFAESEWDGPAYTLTLRYGTDSWPTYGVNPWLSVESVQLQDLPDSVVGSDGPSGAMLAHRGLFHLVNQVPTPEMPPKLRHRFWARVLREVVDSRSREWQSWPTISWTLDGSRIEARLLRFGGGWTGFAQIDQESGVVVNGAGIEPANLALETVRDGGPYGVDLSAPIADQTASSAREAALGGEDEEPDWDPAVVHPDMLALLPGTEAEAGSQR